MKKTLPVLEMSCAACAGSVESIVAAQNGVQTAHVNYGNQTLYIEYDEEQISDEELQKAVQSIGYDLVLPSESESKDIEQIRDKKYKALRRDTILAGIFAVPVAVLGMFGMEIPGIEWILLVLTTPVIFWFGRRFFVNAWKQARHGKANMDTLVAISTGLAFVFSAFNTFFPGFFESQGMEAHVYYEAAAVVVFFILLGRYLEDGAKHKTSDAIKKLLNLQPPEVELVGENGNKVLPLEAVGVGDRILIRPGDRVPLDGKVVSGQSFVDESMINGEPIPVFKETGTSVFAGTLNTDGSFEFVAEKVGSETLLAQIIDTVEKAQGSKAEVQNLVDKIAGIFVPIVLLISIATFFAWYLSSSDHALAKALLTSITVLVIACPCALGLATPTAIIAGVGKGAEHGILIKDAQSLETTRELDVLIVDKTGTLTKGKPELHHSHWLDRAGQTEHAVLYQLASRSTHPLSKSIAASMEVPGETMPLKKFESIGGKGLKAHALDQDFYLGSMDYLLDQNISVDTGFEQKINTWKKEGNSMVGFSNEQELLALFALRDPLKETTPAAIRALQQSGLEVHMLTGDLEASARLIADELGITHFKASCSPSDKADYIRSLQSQGKKVGMAGDGINDSEALAVADLSIAMASGSDIAMEVADITLLKSDLEQVSKALKLSRKTFNTIRQNLFWAFIYNTIGIPLAAGLMLPLTGSFLNPMLAGAAMAFSSVSVVSNSLRLRRVQL
jgi:Cu2+-exporting ATPase